MPVTFSPHFIVHVRLLYKLALDQLVSGKVVRYGINCYTDYAAPAYVSAVAAIEALTNEITFGAAAKDVFPTSPLWNLDKAWVEKLEILNKLVVVSHLLFNKNFEREHQPYQDMAILIKIRNDFVHYKMDYRIPRYIRPLEERGIALPASSEDADFLWVHKVSTSEGIRWANNTACKVAKTFIGFIPEEHKQIMLASLLQNFIEISDDQARNRLQQSGIS